MTFEARLRKNLLLLWLAGVAINTVILLWIGAGKFSTITLLLIALGLASLNAFIGGLIYLALLALYKNALYKKRKLFD